MLLLPNNIELPPCLFSDQHACVLWFGASTSMDSVFNNFFSSILWSNPFQYGDQYETHTYWLTDIRLVINRYNINEHWLTDIRLVISRYNINEHTYYSLIILQKSLIVYLVITKLLLIINNILIDHRIYMHRIISTSWAKFYAFR